MKQVIYETKVETYSYDFVDGQKVEATKKLDYADTVSELHIFADEGKVFKSKADGAVLTNHIGLGSDDSADNYEEIESA